MSKRLFRFYSSKDDEKGLTANQLKRASRATQKACLIHWFYRNHFEGPFDVPPPSFIGNDFIRHAELEKYFRGSETPLQGLQFFAGLVDASVIEDAADEIRAPNMCWCRYNGDGHATDKFFSEKTDIEEFEKSLRSIANSEITPDGDVFNNAFELRRRNNIVYGLDNLDRHLRRMPQRWEKIVDNRKPQDQEEGQQQASELREASAAIRAELSKTTPTTDTIASSALTLTKTLKWLKTFHSVVKELSDIGSTIGGRLLAAEGAWKLMESDIHQILHSIGEWMQVVIHLPF